MGIRIAILSDVHSNWPALQAVGKHLPNQSPDAIYCLGDIVGYGPDPQECVQWIQANANIVVRGNHDDGVVKVAAGQEVVDHNHIAVLAMMKNLEKLSKDDLAYLGQLPYQMFFETINLIISHGCIHEPEGWDYIRYPQEARGQMQFMQTRFACVGHTHQPTIWTGSNSPVRLSYPHEPYKLSAVQKHIINVGSVGQPRDRDPRACYVTIDFYQRKIVVRYHRVSYDIESTIKGLNQMGMQGLLSRRLGLGI